MYSWNGFLILYVCMLYSGIPLYILYAFLLILMAIAKISINNCKINVSAGWKLLSKDVKMQNFVCELTINLVQKNAFSYTRNWLRNVCQNIFQGKRNKVFLIRIFLHKKKCFRKLTACFQTKSCTNTFFLLALEFSIVLLSGEIRKWYGR